MAYRDCAVYVDPLIRAARGLTRPLPPRNVIPRDVPALARRGVQPGLRQLPRPHALSYVARLVQRRFGVNPETLHRFARKVFASLTGPQALLPETIYYYDHALLPDGDWRLVDTGQPPCWR